MLLDVSGLTVGFRTARGFLSAVDGVSFSVGEGEIVAVVGESGCGKSVTALALMGLIDPRVGEVVGGSAYFDGTDLLALKPAALRTMRGAKLAMVFQEPMTSLNPVMRVGAQIAEAISAHEGLDAAAARARARARVIDLLVRAGIPDPEHRARAWPHQLSGGMRQRVMIAMAVACRPKLLIADEATTALDVTIQAQILELLKDLREELGSSILLITHDLGVVAELADRVMVLYAGRVVEFGAVQTIFSAPGHPYTRALMAALPGGGTERTPLYEIDGVVPPLHAMPSGCRFAPRCPLRIEACTVAPPPMVDLARGQSAACIRVPLPTA